MINRGLRLFIFSLPLLLSFSFIAAIITAQETETQSNTVPDCALDVASVATTVEQACSGLMQDGICYGNTSVNAVPRGNVLPGPFERPGDEVAVLDVRSLYLSELNVDADTWGIAQMHLLANLTTVPESLLFLLFGDSGLEDASTDQANGAATALVNVVSTTDVLMRSQPSLNSLQLEVINAGETVTAIARLEDNSWVRVREDDEFGRVGWVDASLIDPAMAEAIATLPIHTADTPYWGPMQALYFRSGSSPSCGNMVTDGMLIQTPEGVAQLSLLINEVSIELLGTATTGATAFIEADPATGMNLSMLSGGARVSVDGQTTTVGTNQRVTIPMQVPADAEADSLDMVASGPASAPAPIAVDLVDNLTLLPTLRNNPIIDRVSAPVADDINAVEPVASSTYTPLPPPPPIATLVPTNTPIPTHPPTSTPTPTNTRIPWDTIGNEN